MMDPQAFLRTWRIGATDCHQACTALVTGKDVSGPLMPSARLPFHPSLVDGAGPGAFCGHALQDLEVWQILLVKPVERKTKCSFHPMLYMLFVWNPLPKPRCYSHLIEHSMCGETNDCKIDSGALHSLPVTLPCRHTCTRTGPPWQWFQYNMRPNICSM